MIWFIHAEVVAALRPKPNATICGQPVHIPMDRWVVVMATWGRDGKAMFVDGERQ